MNESPADSSSDNSVDAVLIERLATGDTDALADAFDRYRPKLWRMVRFRMDPRLATRVDPDDVLQESYLNAASRVRHYLSDTSRSLFVWFRLIVGQTLVDVHRRHLKAEKRDAHRDVLLGEVRYPQAPSVSLAAELIGSITSPSHAVARDEVQQQLENAISSMTEIEQEIIALRHFEHLSNSEVAEVLDIRPTAASNRYVRAISRLKDILRDIPDFFDGQSIE